jgi:anti-sigma B factor antagonist
MNTCPPLRANRVYPAYLRNYSKWPDIMPVRIIVVVVVYDKPGKDRAAGGSQPPSMRRGSASWGVTVTSVPQLNVTIKQQGQVCVLSVSGELDIATAPILAGQAAALHGLAGRLIVDLSGLEFMDGKGARTLAAVTSAAPPGCPVLVRGLTRRFRKLFDILGLPLERHGEVTMGPRRVGEAGIAGAAVMGAAGPRRQRGPDRQVPPGHGSGIGAAGQGPGPGLKAVAAIPGQHLVSGKAPLVTAAFMRASNASYDVDEGRPRLG